MRNLRYVLLLVCAVCVFLVCGCGSAGGAGKILDFADADIKAEARDGFFGGRYASFEVTASVTNNTGKPINEDNLPSLSWDGGEAKPRLSQDKLLERETCNVTWKEELAVNGSEIPELSFSGDVEYTGLDDCQSDLNGRLQDIAAKYAADDAAREEERAAKEKANAEAKQKREGDKEALGACKGKTAYEAYEVASGTDFEPKFLDVADVDVTNDVSDKSEAGKAKVTEVNIAEAGWFNGDEVSFTLDYEGAVTKAEREKKEAEEAASKQAEEKLSALEDAIPQEVAYKAAVVSFTNQTADDVFASDGNTHDPSKYHSYSDRSGFYLEPRSKGTWSYKDESTWRVDDMEFAIANLGTLVKASCDVHFDGENYVISNQGGMIYSPGHEEFATHLDEYEKESWSAQARVVSPDLLS